MKKILILSPIFILFLVIVILTVFTFRTGPLIDSIKDRYAAEFKYVPDSAWKININNEYRITAEILERDRNFLVNWFSNPELLKKNLDDERFKKNHQENTTNQNLIIMQALKEKFLDKEEFDTFIWITIRDAIVQYYLTKKLKEKNSDILKIEPDDSEIDEIYKKYDKGFSTLGLSGEKAKLQLKQSIMNQRRTIELKKFEQSILDDLKLNNSIKFAK
ncbi:MAG: hypothetical protein JW864_13820 [Spirochaetes bacterium]|nr:hypothetical protein [Spirochaetota bacterium]